MFDCFLAQNLVLLLLFLCSTRLFVLKAARIDPFSVFAPIALVISIFIFVCFDFSLFNFALFLLSLLVFFTNFRAVLRFHAKLIIDNYSAVFIIFSILSIILTVALAVILFLFRPVKYNEKDFGVIKKQHVLTGNSSNLRIRESFFTGERFSGNLFVYEPVVKDEINAEIYSENPVLIFVPGIRASVQNYEPYFMLLAQKGYTVVSADFYTSDLSLISNDVENPVAKYILESKFFRRFAVLTKEFLDSENFAKMLEDEKPIFTKKYSALTRLALELFGDDAKVFYVVDGVDFDTIYDVIDEFNTEPYANAKGFFSLNRVDEYKTSGYGFIEQTDVLLAHAKGIERENKFFIARYAAGKTIKAIEENKSNKF